MSHVADIILLTFLDDPGIEKAQQWLLENKWPQLVEISDHAGGNKAMQCEVWAAAINHFDIAAFAKVVAEIKWEWPEYVQLLVKDENEDRFTLRAGSPANASGQPCRKPSTETNET